MQFAGGAETISYAVQDGPWNENNPVVDWQTVGDDINGYNMVYKMPSLNKSESLITILSVVFLIWLVFYRFAFYGKA